jgi:hypothetical protein
MLVAQFSCPQCGIILKTANPQPAGRMVKCPKCNSTFAVAETGTSPEPADRGFEPQYVDADSLGVDAAYQDGPLKKADNTALILVTVILLCAGLLAAGGGFLIWYTSRTPEPRVLSVPEGLKAPKHIAVGKAGAGAPQPPAERKPDKPRPAPNPLEGLGGNPLAGFDWSRLNLADVSLGNLEAKSAADFEVLKYLPADVNLVVGADADSLRSNPELAKWFESQNRPDNPIQIDPRDIEEVAAAMTLPLAEFGSAGLSESKFGFLSVVKTTRDIDLAEIAQKSKGEKAEAQGRIYYRFELPDKGPMFLYAPSERIVMVGQMERLEAALAVDPGKAVLRPELKRLLATVGKAHFWMCLAVDEKAKTEFNRVFKPLSGNLTPEAQRLVAGLMKLDSAALWGRLHDKHLNLAIAADFPEPADADQISQLAQELWVKQGQPQLDGIKPLLGKAQDVATDLGRSLKISKQDQVVVASADITYKSLDSIKQIAQPSAPGGIKPFRLAKPIAK